MLVVLASLASAFAYAVAAVLQQRAAAAQPAEQNLRPSLLVALCRRPLWLVGIAASGVGLVLQLVALRTGSLTVVQPILVTGLVFALPISALVRRRAPAGRDLTAACVVAVGLALFLVAAGPGGGSAEPSPRGWLATIAIAGVVAAGLLVVSLRLSGAGRAALQATAAGIANGFSAALIKATARQLGDALHHGFGATVKALVTSPEVYGLGVSLVVVMLLVQSAFQSGPIAWSLPSLTALNPLTAVAIGIGALHEHVALGVVASGGELIGLAAALGGVAMLGRSPSLEQPPVTALAPMATPTQPAPAQPGTAQPGLASSGTSISARVSDPWRETNS